MTDVEAQILETLLELDGAVKSMATVRVKPNLQPLFARLEQLTRELPKSAPPDLLHYMHRKSYEKARLFLKGRNAENAQDKCHE